MFWKKNIPCISTLKNSTPLIQETVMISKLITHHSIVRIRSQGTTFIMNSSEIHTLFTKNCAQFQSIKSLKKTFTVSRRSHWQNTSTHALSKQALVHIRYRITRHVKVVSRHGFNKRWRNGFLWQQGSFLSLEYRGRLRIIVLRSRENNYKRQIHATPYLFKEHT